MYIYSWKKMRNIWPILVILYVKHRCFFISRGVQLDNGADPPWLKFLVLLLLPPLVGLGVAYLLLSLGFMDQKFFECVLYSYAMTMGFMDQKFFECVLYSYATSIIMIWFFKSRSASIKGFKFGQTMSSFHSKGLQIFKCGIHKICKLHVVGNFNTFLSMEH